MLAKDLELVKITDGLKPTMKPRNDTAVVSFVKEIPRDGFIQFAVFNTNTATFDNEIVTNGNFYRPTYIYNYGSQSAVILHNHNLNGFNVVESTIVKTKGTDSTLSQMAQMDIDSKGKSHYCFGVITPINSEVIYAKNANITGRSTIRKETFKVYPNPFTNHIKIDGKFETVKTYDSNGKLISFSNNAIIDLSQLSVGCYNLMIDGVQTLIIKSK
jgi:hypothetical protein|tara:strand:- start:17680 stop:18324 length:645 start_codon:yes stop_codon:yes gene_type:complete